MIKQRKLIETKDYDVRYMVLFSNQVVIIDTEWEVMKKVRKYLSAHPSVRLEDMLVTNKTIAQTTTLDTR